MTCIARAAGAAAALCCVLIFAQAGVAQEASQNQETSQPAAADRATSLADSSFVLPRTPDGRPDFQGVVWTTNFFGPLAAMPQIFSSKLVLSEEEAEKAFQRFLGLFSSNPLITIDPEATALLAESDGLPTVRGQRRSRLLVMPADGALPYTPEALKEASSGMASMMTQPADNPEERPTGERCLALGGAPPVALTSSLNPRRFIQTAHHVVIHSEYGDEVRIVPYAAAPKAPALPSWMGDAFARWEGDTLVIETAGLPAVDRLRGAFPVGLIVSAHATVIERYTRIGEDELLYQFTVKDPEVYTAPWLAEYSLYRADYRMYPSSCHEGNYSLPNILSGQRVADARTDSK